MIFKKEEKKKNRREIHLADW